MKLRLVGMITPTALAVSAIVVALALQAAPAKAAILQFTATLNEAQSLNVCNPNPPPPAGGGFAVVDYDTTTNQLSWTITFSNLSGPAIAAHFHGPAMANQNGTIQVPINDLTSPSQETATLTEPQEADLLNGLYYINFHTAVCPSGEIRGQVLERVVLGGVAEFPQLADRAPLAQPDSSAGHAGLWVAIATVVAGAGALSGAGWYLRKRRFSSRP